MLKQKQNKRFFIFIFLNINFYVGPYIDGFFLFLIFIYLFIIIFLLKLINSAAQNHCLPRQKDAYGNEYGSNFETSIIMNAWMRR